MTIDRFIPEAVGLLKNQFVRDYKSRRSLLTEIIPLHYSKSLPIANDVLDSLHKFAIANPIYFNSHDIEISRVSCRIYEGDINDYWLSSKKHDTSYQPFYPTWMLSAYALSLESRRLGFEEVVDIGSGDGRIAYCSKLLGMKSVGIEIDSDLVNLQYKISNSTNIKYSILNEDATTVEYCKLNLSK